MGYLYKDPVHRDLRRIRYDLSFADRATHSGRLLFSDTLCAKNKEEKISVVYADTPIHLFGADRLSGSHNGGLARTVFDNVAEFA